MDLRGHSFIHVHDVRLLWPFLFLLLVFVIFAVLAVLAVLAFLTVFVLAGFVCTAWADDSRLCNLLGFDGRCGR